MVVEGGGRAAEQGGDRADPGSANGEHKKTEQKQISSVEHGLIRGSLLGCVLHKEVAAAAGVHFIHDTKICRVPLSHTHTDTQPQMMDAAQ